jgi:plasmid maintenance system antidote protein VapI
MTPEQFCTIGRALYGPKWQRALAGALDIGERQVRHYAAGSRELPADMGERLARCLYGHADKLTALANRTKL